VTKLESIKPSNLTYGLLIDDTAFRFLPAERDKAKIKIIGADN